MASTSNLVTISQESVVLSSSKIFEKEERCRRWWISVPFAVAALVLMIVYLAYNTESCVLFINGTRNATLRKEGNCSLVQQKYTHLTGHEVREEKSYPRSDGVLIAFVVCLVIALLVFVPFNPNNYISCCRRVTCCCKQTSLKDAINRYMTCYISDEARFQQVIQSAQSGLDMIIYKLKHYIPEVTFDVLKTGSLVERLGKPTVLEHGETLLIKSVLCTDFDVMLTPQTVLAGAATEGPQIGQTLFSVVTFQNITPGFVWLKLNKDFQESRNMYWRNLCNEFTFPDGSKGVYLSSLEVRNVFVKGMKLIKRKETGRFDFFKKMSDEGVSFDVKAQGPAVTVMVESRESFGCWGTCRPTLFYGDFIFAIRCIGWPQEAREWPMRQRYWPQPAVIQEIIMYGYHVVPKPSFPFQDKKKKKKKKKENENQSITEY
nr:mab-21 [Haliclona caerulea]